MYRVFAWRTACLTSGVTSSTQSMVFGCFSGKLWASKSPSSKLVRRMTPWSLVFWRQSVKGRSSCAISAGAAYTINLGFFAVFSMCSPFVFSPGCCTRRSTSFTEWATTSSLPVVVLTTLRILIPSFTGSTVADNLARNWSSVNPPLLPSHEEFGPGPVCDDSERPAGSELLAGSVWMCFWSFVWCGPEARTWGLLVAPFLVDRLSPAVSSPVSAGGPDFGGEYPTPS